MIYYIYKGTQVYGCTEDETLIADIATTYGLTDYSLGTTEYEDYDPYNNKYILQHGQIVLNPNYEQEEKIKANQERNREIDNKIQELQQMALPEILNGNVENIKLYNDVIAGLEQARP